MTDKQFSRLPKAVQQDINTLRANLERAEKKLNTMLGKGKTNVHIHNYPENIPLPKNSEITFKVGDKYRDRFDVRIRDEGIYIMGLESLIVLPESSNVVLIKRRERRP